MRIKIAGFILSSIFPILVFSQPNISQWEANMLQYGTAHCANVTTWENTLQDAQRATFQIAERLNRNEFYTCGDRLGALYRDQYVIPNNGVVPAYYNFTTGLLKDWQRNSDATSRAALQMLADNGSWCPDTAYNNINLPLYENHRENAYCGLANLDKFKAGLGLNPRIKSFFLENSLRSLQQAETAPWIKPFMLAIVSEFLINYYHDVELDPRIPTALQRLADFMWTRAWDETSQSFFYIVPSYGNEVQAPAVDLNLMIAPLYAWLGDATKFDKIFNSGVAGAYLVNPKQFWQNYRWSFDGVRWRSYLTIPTPTPINTPPPTPTRTPTIVPTNTPTRTPTVTPTVTKTPTPFVTPTKTPCPTNVNLSGHECRIKRLEGR